MAYQDRQRIKDEILGKLANLRSNPTGSYFNNIEGNSMNTTSPAFSAIGAVNNFAKGDNVNGALDVAKTGAMFIPGVGQIASGAISIWQMVRNALNGKRQQAMQKSAEENAKSQAQSINALEQNKQDFDNIQQANQQRMQQAQDIQNASQQIPPLQPVEPIAVQPEVTQQVATPDAVQAAEKQSLIDSIKNGISDFQAGYQDNVNSSLSTGDLFGGLNNNVEATPEQNANGAFELSADSTKKGLMTHLGELVGTGQRIASHPLTQAAIAAGISKLSGGDAGDMAKAALEYGSAKAKADRYYQQATGNTDRPFFNSYDINDYNSKIKQDQWQKEYDTKLDQWQKNYDKQAEQWQKNYDRQVDQWQKDYALKKSNYDRNYELGKQRNAIQEKYNNARISRSSGNRTNTRFDPTSIPEFYDDYYRVEELENLEKGSDAYNKEVDDVLASWTNTGKEGFTPDGIFGGYSRGQREKAEKFVDDTIAKQRKDFNKKYRINPMKGKK